MDYGYEGLVAPCPECGDEYGACEHRWGNRRETCKECGTDTCHRTNVNPYCAATIRIRCELCGRVRTVSGLHFCPDEESE